MITYVIAGCLILLFGAVVFRGAPYVPTHHASIEDALDLLPLEQGSLILDLGSGDGSVLLQAAKRGYRAVGYEINPLLAGIAWLRSWRHHAHVTVHVHDFWLANWPLEATGAFVFLARPYMRKLKTKLDREMARRTEPMYVVSYGFTIPGLIPKKVSKGMYLYELKPR